MTTCHNVREPVGLLILLIVSLAFMKFRLAGIPLSDLMLLGCAAVLFIRSGRLHFTIQSWLLLGFLLLSMLLAVFLAGSASMVSAGKLLVPLVALLITQSYFARLDQAAMFRLTQQILFILVFSQLFFVLLFYSQQAGFLFHLVEPGNINRDEAGFRVNVYRVPFLGLYRFGSLFVEPSWFALFTGFFLLLWFYLLRQQGHDRIRPHQHLAIILAFGMTLSFTALVFLLVSYLYRFIDQRYPMRLIIAAPLCLAFIGWVLLTNDYLAHRVVLIATGQDGSVNARIFASWDKAIFILQHSDYLGAAPGKPIDLINQYFQVNLSIQNAYLESLAATGIAGCILFVLAMHYSWFIHPKPMLQLPLVLSLLVSSVVYTPIYWILAFYLYHIARALQANEPDGNRNA